MNVDGDMEKTHNGYTNTSFDGNLAEKQNGDMNAATPPTDSEKEEGGDSCLQKCCKCSCFESCSNAIINCFESFYYKVGRLIGNHPYLVILVMVVVAGLCGIGLINFSEETAPEKLWSPQDSAAQKDEDWVKENFPSYDVPANLIFEDTDVLTPTAFSALANMYEIVINITVPGYTWDTICTKIGPRCTVFSILEVWAFNIPRIRRLSRYDIINDLNNYIRSAQLGQSDVVRNLGGISRNSTHIIGAQATKMTFLIRGNETSVFNDRDDYILEWEQKFIDAGAVKDPNIKNQYYFAIRSFSDLAADAIGSDVVMLSAGYMLILVYVMLVLGRFNCVQHKVYVSLVGIVCVGLSLLVSFGLSSAFGLKYTPVHSILPFLLLGIGVDDMFVIIQSWTNLTPDEQKKSIKERTALMMKHAGVAITVTSVTDFCAFAVGATTVLPALRSFCLFTAIGVIALLLFQGSVFVAFHSLDERRALVLRNACCPCYRHPEDYKPNSCSQKEIVPTIGEKIYVPILRNLPYRIIMLILTLGLLGWGCYGLSQLEQDYDEFWFLPTDSYGTIYHEADLKYFPSDSVPGNVYTSSEFDYYREGSVLTRLYTDLQNDDYVSTVDSWYEDYRSWLNSTRNPQLPPLLDPNTNFPSNESNFYLSMGLWSKSLTKFANDVRFADKTTYRIHAGKIPYQHTPVDSSSEEIKAMDSVEDIVDSYGYPDDVLLASSLFYPSWETNRIIRMELFRNLGLAGACIFVVTLVLLANFWVCLLVFTCVIFTLIDVTALMYFWGLTVDTVTSINLILAIGLAVDYSAHIAHMFMTVKGSKLDRACTTVTRMGSAVFHGGFSTFLAFVLLSFSNSYVFTVFFKIFFGVVLFGLFHGLIYLPCALSFIGPPPYRSAVARTSAVEDKQPREPDISMSSNL